MKKFILILVPIIICFLIGLIAGQVQELSLKAWYPNLNKSLLTPPNIVFPIVWSILYLLMGISIGLVLISKSKDKTILVILFCIQLLFNFLWSILFFKMQNPSLGIVDIIILDILVLGFILRGLRNHKISSILFIPYVIWLFFASYLNLYIMLNN